MINLLFAGLYKMRKSLFMKVVFLISVVSALIMAWAAHGMAVGTINISATGITAFFSDIQMTALLGSLTAGIFICGDFEDKSIADAVSGGSGRGSVIVTKLLLFIMAILLILLPFFVTAVAAVCAGGEFMAYVPTTILSLMASAGDTTVTMSVVLKMAAIFGVTLIIYVGQLSLCIFLVFLLKKPVLVVGISYAVSFLGGQLAGIGGKAGDMLSFTPFGSEFTKLTLGAEAEAFVKPVVSSICFICLVAAATYFIFRKSEIK